MNCQIINIELDTLELEIISTRINNNLSINQLIEIDQTQYLESRELTINKKPAKSFGKIIELSSSSLKLRLNKPELFVLGKIVKINIVTQEAIFLPLILNQVLVFGEKNKFDSEQVFEFIPTVLVNEQVIQGQKIGYVNSKIPNQQNLRTWILAHKNGKVNSIELGDYKLGQQIASINKSSVLLANQYDSVNTICPLLKTNIASKTISIVKDQTNNLNIKTGQTNLILDIHKKLFNSLKIEANQFDNTIFIFVSQNPDFVASTDIKSITILDKYNLGSALEQSVTDLAMSICGLGYDVIVFAQTYLYLPGVGQYRTINNENVHLTSIIHDCQESNVSHHFDHIANIN